MQILVQFRELDWGSVRETKFIRFEYFSFLFNFVEIFQFSFNFESSVKFFSAEFSVEYSFSCLTWDNFNCRLWFNFTFISWEASCLFKILISVIQEASDETLLLPIFRAFTVWSPNSYFRLILVLFLGKLLALTIWNI